ncbi:MAG: hypothetical protein V3U54_04880 [Thermodesulfobacteriota bacterium]
MEGNAISEKKNNNKSLNETPSNGRSSANIVLPKLRQTADSYGGISDSV